MEVEALIPQLQNTLSEISNTVHGLSTKTQDDELDQLEQKRERLLSDLQASFEKERQELETKHRTDVEEVKKKRKQEDEERVARRRREDEELKKASFKQDKQWQQRRDSAVEIIEDETGQEMDQVEEEARRMVEEGKKRLQDLEEKRRDLNRRIDEQLKQSLPTAPSRKKGRHRKETSNAPKNSTNNDPAPNAPPKNDSALNGSNKSDTPPKHREPGDSAAKSPESKKDGELPFQDQPHGLTQAAKEPAKKPPKSFAEALKSNLSNESKGKIKLEKGSSTCMTKEEGENIKRRDEISLHEPEGKHIGNAANISTSTEDVIARHSSTIAPKRGEYAKGEKNMVEKNELSKKENDEQEGTENQGDTEVPRDAPTTVNPVQPNKDLINSAESNTPAKSKRLSQTSYAQNLSSSESTLTENYKPAIPILGEAEQETQIKLPSERRRITIIDDAELGQSSESTTIHQISAIQEGESKEGYAPAHALKGEVHTVGSKSTHQLPSPSHTYEKRTSRQGNETDDQMEPRQATTPDSPKQGHSGDGRDYLQVIRQSQPCRLSSKTPVKSVPPTPPNSIRGSLSVETDSRSGCEQVRNANIEYLTVEQLARRSSSSPLPVENETVRGQDRLFDDHKSASGHSELHSGDNGSDLSPQTPIEGHDLPVLLDPAFNHKLYEHGLIPLGDESGSWAIVAEQADKDNSHLSSRLTPVQEAGGIGRQDQATPQRVGDNTSHANRLPRDINSIDDKGPSCSQPASVNLLCSGVLSGQADSNPEKRRASPRGAPSKGPGNSKHKRRGSSVEAPRKRLRRRGRQMSRSPQSPERALNPREQLFQGSDDDIDIRSAWFKRSKRGSS